MRFSAGTLLFGLALIAPRVFADEAKPTGNAVPFPDPFPAVAEFARSHHIPVDGIHFSSGDSVPRTGDTIVALATLAKDNIQKQWLVRATLVEPDDQEPPSPPEAAFVLYTSLGSRLEFLGQKVPVEIETAGPFLDVPNAASPRPNIESSRVLVSADFLGLGFDRACRLSLRLRDLAAAKRTDGEQFYFWAGVTPAPNDQIARNRKLTEGLQITFGDERALAGIFPATLEFLRVVTHTLGLDTVLMQTLDSPSA